MDVLPVVKTLQGIEDAPGDWNVTGLNHGMDQEPML